MTTSRLCSTSRLAFSITISATCTWRCGGSSKVELMTSAAATLRCMSVTSSGRSSINRMMVMTSGWLIEIELAMVCSIMVLPVRGGETIRPRCPRPSGVSRSSARPVMSSCWVSNLSRSSG